MSFPRLAAIIVLTVLLTAAIAQATTETATCTFDTFTAPTGYSLTVVNGIADDGTVVGQLVDTSTGQYIGFTYANGAFTKYAAPSSSMTWFYGGNGTGTNAGSYQQSKYPGSIHGFLLQGSQFTQVNHPSATNTWLFDVNQLGAAVGSFSSSPSSIKGFLLVNGNYTTIEHSGAQMTYAQAINNNGLIAGFYTEAGISHGFTWQNGAFTAIDYPKDKYGTNLVGVNDSGVIAGNYMDGDWTLGFIYANGVFKKIVYSGTGVKYTLAGGINNNGVVSGQVIYGAGKSLGYTAICK